MRFSAASSCTISSPLAGSSAQRGADTDRDVTDRFDVRRESALSRHTRPEGIERRRRRMLTWS